MVEVNGLSRLSVATIQNGDRRRYAISRFAQRKDKCIQRLLSVFPRKLLDVFIDDRSTLWVAGLTWFEWHCT